MGNRKALVVALLWFFLCFMYLADGIDLLEDEGMNKGHQNTSISNANSLALPRSRFFSSLDDKITTRDSDWIHHWAILTAKLGGTYFGGKGTLNVYGLPSVTYSQFSTSNIRLGDEKTGEMIEAGWHVQPKLYGDHETHFFVLWTSDRYQKTGCYNFECEGFKLDNASKVIPGYIIRPLSKYNGDQYEITLKIQKNFNTGDWWLFYGRDGDKPVGFWPKSLFKTLAGGAPRIEIGGSISFGNDNFGPPMGSGHFSQEGERKAAYIKHIQFVDKDGLLYTPKNVFLYEDKGDCYNIAGNTDTVYFGGPGGCKS